MTEAEFEKLVARALDGLPQHVQENLDNVAVTIAHRPSKAQQEEGGTYKDSLLLGLYEGIPETAYGKGFGDHLPDKITIFQDAIERIAHSPEEVEQIVADTVWHEVAHYYGYDDEELDEIERRKGIHF